MQLCSGYSVLLFIFTPKLYIILRYPEKNTPDFGKAAVTRNTMKKSFVTQSLPALDWVVSSAEQSEKDSIRNIAHCAIKQWLRGFPSVARGGGGGGTPYNGLYGEAPPERGTFLRLQVYKRVGISKAEVYKRVG